MPWHTLVPNHEFVVRILPLTAPQARDDIGGQRFLFHHRDRQKQCFRQPMEITAWRKYRRPFPSKICLRGLQESRATGFERVGGLEFDFPN